MREMKEQDIRKLWEYLGSFEIERNYEERSKIFLFAVCIFFLTALIASGSFLFDRRFDIYHKMTNAQAKESAEMENRENDHLNMDIDSVNKYKMKSQEDICADSKGKKQTSFLCGKDDEEELKKIAEEEKREAIRMSEKRKPKVRGPMPYVFKKDSMGRKVCNKKNDHPSKSDKNKKGHMDMECCLDPDEIPNPNCYYSPSKYGKYL